MDFNGIRGFLRIKGGFKAKKQQMFSPAAKVGMTSCFNPVNILETRSSGQAPVEHGVPVCFCLLRTMFQHKFFAGLADL